MSYMATVHMQTMLSFMFIYHKLRGISNMKRVSMLIVVAIMIITITACSNVNADEPTVYENIQTPEITPALDNPSFSENVQIAEIAPAPEVGQEKVTDEQLDTLLEFALVGCWHALPLMPAGYSERYVFYTDRMFDFSANSMDQNDRLRDYSGYWHINKGRLVLEINHKIIIEGGEVVPAPYGYCIEGGVYVGLDIEPPEIVNFDIGEISVVDFDDVADWCNHAFSMKIGDMTFWRYNTFDDTINYMLKLDGLGIID